MHGTIAWPHTPSLSLLQDPVGFSVRLIGAERGLVTVLLAQRVVGACRNERYLGACLREFRAVRVTYVIAMCHGSRQPKVGKLKGRRGGGAWEKSAD